MKEKGADLEKLFLTDDKIKVLRIVEEATLNETIKWHKKLAEPNRNNHTLEGHSRNLIFTFRYKIETPRFIPIGPDDIKIKYFLMIIREKNSGEEKTLFYENDASLTEKAMMAYLIAKYSINL